MPGTPRLTSGDLAALRCVASGEHDIDHASRYRLSVCQLIDETGAGWRVTARGRDFLRRLATQTRGDVEPVSDARFLMISSSIAELHR